MTSPTAAARPSFASVRLGRNARIAIASVVFVGVFYAFIAHSNSRTR